HDGAGGGGRAHGGRHEGGRGEDDEAQRTSEEDDAGKHAPRTFAPFAKALRACSPLVRRACAARLCAPRVSAARASAALPACARAPPRWLSAIRRLSGILSARPACRAAPTAFWLR